jgi:ABC-type cobalamin/Fe3+-siderophores transport system ATPase subunit
MIKLGVRVSGVLVYVCHRPKHIMSLLTKLLLIWQDKFFSHAQISITRTGTVLLKIYGLPTYSMKHLSSKQSKHLLQYNVFFFLFPFLVFF